MKITTYKSEEEWLDGRRGRITGTTAKDVMPKERGTGPRAGFYAIVAERVALPATDENVMDRGHRLEEEAILRFNEETGKKFKQVQFTICERDDESSIAYSPDGLPEGYENYDCIGEDVEVKCRNSAAHIEAILTGKIPSIYESQIIQGFVVNENLQTRYMVFYDPRCPKDLFYIEINRKDMQEEIEEYLKFERIALEKIAEIEQQLTF